MTHAVPDPKPILNFVGGKWVSAGGSESLTVSNPATGESLGSFAPSTEENVTDAVSVAKEAFQTWRSTPPIERVRILFRLKILLEENLEGIAASLAREHGKNLPECRGEVRRGIENVEHACGTPSLMMGSTLEDVAPGIDCETVLQPLGVFAGIAPYNFPVMIPLWFWPYAVATGNTFVLKPSEQDPLTHQLVVELAVEAGLPDGVLNVVQGQRNAVTALLNNPDVIGFSFVGSSAVGRKLYSEGAVSGKRMQVLGGAKNNIIVVPDADYDLTTEAILSSAFGSAGQRCLAGSTAVCIGDAYEIMRERLVDGAKSLKLGYALDGDPDIGPVISRAHRTRVETYIEKGIKEGAELLLDGRGATVDGYPDGHWIGPTIFDKVEPDMVVGKEEIFGPVLSLKQVGSLEEAIELTHKSRYGNMASIFTTSGAAAREFRYGVGISMLGVNIGVAAPMAFFPFGGARRSFFGDLKAQGQDTISFYTDKRVVISRW